MLAVFLLFCLSCVGAILFFRWRLPDARTVEELQRLLLPASLIGLVILICGTIFSIIASETRRFSNLPLTDSSLTVMQAAHGTPVVISGRVSDQNPPLQGSYVALISSMNGEKLRRTPRLYIDLVDGPVGIINEDYQQINWPVDTFANGKVIYLQTGQHVIIDGYVERVLSADQPAEQVTIRARNVLAGDHQNYLSVMRREMFFPSLMSYVGWLAGVAVAIFIPVVWFIRLTRREDDLPPEPVGDDYWPEDDQMYPE